MKTLTLDKLAGMEVAKGGHKTREGALCAMELVAWLAGEPHTDRPQCTSRVIGLLIRRWNDDLSDGDRTRLLRPLLPSLVGTRGTKKQESHRVGMIMDWCIRECTPAWLDLSPPLNIHAAKLRSMAPLSMVTSRASNDAWDVVRAVIKDVATEARDKRMRAATDSMEGPVKHMKWIIGMGHGMERGISFR